MREGVYLFPMEFGLLLRISMAISTLNVKLSYLQLFTNSHATACQLEILD